MFDNHYMSTTGSFCRFIVSLNVVTRKHGVLVFFAKDFSKFGVMFSNIIRISFWLADGSDVLICALSLTMNEVTDPRLIDNA